MKILALLFCLLSLGEAQNLHVQNVKAMDVSHSSALIVWDTVDDSGNPVTPGYIRIRYTPASSGDCTSGTGGTIESSEYSPDHAYRRATRMQYVLSGLTANTVYKVCPEDAISGSDAQHGTANWSTIATSLTLTTLPLPAVHPAQPILPVQFRPVYPDTTGFVQVYLDSACNSDNLSHTEASWRNASLQAVLDRAANEQLDHGTVIYGKTGTSRTVCGSGYKFNEDSAGVMHFSASDIDLTGSTIDFGVNLTEGALVRFSTKYSGLPGSGPNIPLYTQDPPKSCTGILPAHPYYIHKPDPTGHPNRFSLTCGAPFGQNDIEGFPAKSMVFNNTHGPYGTNIKMIAYPNTIHPIVIRPDVPDSQFAPVNTRISPAWKSKMPELLLTFQGDNFPPGYALPTNVSTFSFITQDEDGNNGQMIDNVYFRGWEFTHIDDLDSRMSTDPGYFLKMIATSMQSGNITFDQIYFHGLGAPHRFWKPVNLDGYRIAFINSYSENMDIYQSSYDGLGLTKTANSTFKIGSGLHALNGAARLTLSSDMNVSLSGSGSGDIFVYSELDGSRITLSLPPGVDATCDAPCNILSTQNAATGLGNGVFQNGDAFPGVVGGDSLYFVDPFFNTTATTSGAVSLMAHVVDPSQADITSSPEWYPNPVTLAVTFKADMNGFITAIRFWKDARDTTATHAVKLWDAASQTQLGTATTSSETSSGWQTATFGTPVAVTSGLLYKASYYSPIGGVFTNNWYYNGGIFNGHLKSTGTYHGRQAGCDVNDAFPRNWANHIRVGIIGCVGVSSGTVSYVQFGNAEMPSNSGLQSSSGSNAFIAGRGPGPFTIRNNYFSITGLPFHFDEGGIGGNFRDPYDWRGIPVLWRGDGTVYRNYFTTPLEHMRALWPGRIGPNGQLTMNSDNADAYDPALYAKSNKLFYQQRQPLEVKDGDRWLFNANIFDGGFSSNSASDFIALTAVVDEGITDVTIQNNTFKHGPGGIVGMSSTVGGDMQTNATKRMNVSNNLFWDFRSAYWAPGWGSVLGKGAGWIFQPIAFEDVTIKHNTIYNVSGNSPSFILANDQRREGIVIQDNIIKIVGSNGFDSRFGVGEDGSGISSGPIQCSVFGENFVNCAFVNSSFTHNLLMSDVPAANFSPTYWSSSTNIIPTDPRDAAAVKWIDSDNAVTLNTKEPNFRLLNGSSYISGGSLKATDGTDIGANVDTLEDDQGKVTLYGAKPGSNGTSAVITFRMPDNQPVTIDYGSTDPTLINTFTRVNDGTAAKGSHSVTITGLTPGTLYYFRVNGEVEQPMGKFVALAR